MDLFKTNRKSVSFAAWVLQVLISLQFVLSGLGKFFDAESSERRFRSWGYPDDFFYLVGVAELALAILILVPKTCRPAAVGTLVLMIGATITHLRAGDGHYWAAVITGIVAGLVYYLRKRLGTAS